MHASRLVTLSVFSLALVSTAAWADGTTKPRPQARVVELDPTVITGKPARPLVAVDVSRIVPRAPLPDLRQPLLDRIAAAADNEPF
jgi:hypothetical protein